LQGMLSVMIVPPAVADDLVVYIEINSLLMYTHFGRKVVKSNF
jgi:hypothetical protein